MRSLLSTFVDIFDETVVAEAAEEVAEAIVAEPVEAEATEEAAEAVVAETVETETAVLDTDIVYKRPEKKKEPVIDLSKPEVQDAEMVDDKD